MSNQAAEVIIVPIAIQTAQRLGFDPRTFAIMIAVGTSCSFITPLEPACLMVYNPGNYRFFDFTKVGGLLTLVIFGIVTLMVPTLWPL
jgi:di/tricarboxylate transporter